MSTLLDAAARMDPVRDRDLAANDGAMRGPLRAFLVQVKQGQRVLSSFEAMAPCAVDCTTQHLDLAGPGSYLFVSPIGGAA